MTTTCDHHCCTDSDKLTWSLNLDATLAQLENHAQQPESRFRAGSPCRWVKHIDILIHIVLPEWLEKHTPRLARTLRNTSPRWGRSWRHCITNR